MTKLKPLLLLIAITFSQLLSISPAFALKKETLDHYDLNGIYFYNPENCANTSSAIADTLRGAPVSGDQVTWIGDSYSDGYESEISAKLPGVDFGPDNYYTRYSKHMKWDGSDTTGREGGLTLIKKAKAENKLREHIVFALGTNLEGETTTKEGAAKVIQEIIDAAGTSTGITFVTAYTATEPESYNGLNEAMREAANQNDQISVADWASVASSHSAEYYGGGDGGHPNDKGHDIWINTIVETLSTAGAKSTDSTLAASDFSTDSPNNLAYDGQTKIFEDEQWTTIGEYSALYKKAADEVGIPWAMLAVIHILESGQTRTNPGNGQGLFQDFTGQSQHPDLYAPGLETDENNFVEQAKIAAKGLKDNNPELSTNSNDDIIKHAFFAYNGQASVYIKQAKDLGFSDAEARNGEGSPYVMNRADARRDPTAGATNWGQIKTDGGPIQYPANNHFGAFVMYAAIAGLNPAANLSSSDYCCANPTTTQTNLGDFTKYDMLSAADIQDLAEMASHENGADINMFKNELSIMANLYEKNGNNEGLMKYLARKPGSEHGWFSTYALINGKTDDNITPEYLEATKDVFMNGNRTLPYEIDEHDSITDIISATNNGASVLGDHSKWQQGVTVINNNSGSTYTFYGWIGDTVDSGDPIGYTGNAPTKLPNTGTTNAATGNLNIECADDCVETGTANAIAQTAVSMSWPIQEGSDKGKCKTLSGSLIDYVFNDVSCGYNPRDTYEQAVEKYQIPHISTGGYEGCKDSTYCDCGMFVWTVLAAALPNEITNEDKFNPNAGEGSEFNSYMQTSPNWEEIPNDGTEDILKPGDVLQGPGHRIIYVGEYGGEYGTFAHASAGTRSGEIGSFYTQSFHIFRYKGKGSSITCSSTTGDVKALQNKVLELAWPKNTHGTERKPEYTKVVEKYESGQVENYSYVGGCSGVDCGAWVSILMRESGWDPDYNSGGGPTSHQLEYLQNSDKWESLNTIGQDIPEEKLKPGDVAVNTGHTYVYVGEIEGFDTHIASASLCERAPTAGGETPGDGSYYWFRRK